MLIIFFSWKIQQTETRFLGSCCLCQHHCKQEEAAETSAELNSQKLCFLPEFRLEEIIEISLSKCVEQVTSLFLQLRSTNSAHDDLNTSSSDHHFFGCGDSKSGQVWSLENIEQWPESLRAEVDLLTSAVVCLEDSAFTRLMQNLLMRLVSNLLVYYEIDSVLWDLLIKFSTAQISD